MIDLMCEKCAGREILTRFHKGSTYWGDSLHCASGECASGDVNVRRDEHLHYRCKTCQYDWTGDTADMQKAEPA